MDSISIFTGLVLLLLLSLAHLMIKLFFIFYNNHSSNNMKNNLPPSPPSLPFIGHLPLILKKPLHQSLSAMTSLHGPLLLLRFGSRPAVVISSAPLADECLTTNDLALANRPKFPSSRTSSYNYTIMASAAYGPGWREMRRVSTIQVLSVHRLSFFADVRAAEARTLARRLFHDTSSPDHEFKTVQLRSRLFGLALNVIMMMMVGKRYYGGEPDDAVSRQFEEMVEEGFALAGASNIGDFLPWPLGWIARIGVERKLARIHNNTDQLTQTLINEQRKMRKASAAAEEEEAEHSILYEKRKNKTLIESLLSLQESQPEQYTDLFIKSLVSSLLPAGTHTSSITIEWAVSLLLNNPEKLDKLMHEIDDRVGCGRLLEESDLPKLPYLKNVISETLRMYPAGPLLVPHESVKECKVGGCTIPGGTMVLINVYAIQRDPEIWSEPTKFLPERFTEDSKLKRSKIFPFGMGRRRCPGEALAMMEVGLVLGTLVQCFEWRRVESEDVDMKEGSGLSLPKEHPLQALCRPRQSMISMLSQF
ncbi:Isoflavone 2'-hydroxylase [Platanthera guangdongensis]|uniref:Isoflavone 2'-hydroxylase n=1 Tax=Platanthera guangdongensis TaxID=2320717 RepID=A0ABR2LY14_9ASPA